MTTETKQYICPRVNIIDRPDSVVLEAELPGVPKNGVDIEINQGELTLIGHRKDEHQGRYYIAERPQADYRRVFALSEAIDTQHVEAAMEGGVLTLTLHKTEERKPKKIEIH
jgi:HSP20 family protein